MRTSASTAALKAAHRYEHATLCNNMQAVSITRRTHAAICIYSATYYVPLGSPSRPTTICVSSVCDDTTASCTFTDEPGPDFPSCSTD
jgi:hypothetical protein